MGVAEFDHLAEHYDLTRGGESRGDQYAAELDAILPEGDAVVLEIGVGTGVVALGLARRQRRVVGVDVSAPMLEFAQRRLGNVVVRGDGTRLPFASRSVSHAVAVWVVHAVGQPVKLFAEAARVIAPGGLATALARCPLHRRRLSLSRLAPPLPAARGLFPSWLGCALADL